MCTNNINDRLIDCENQIIKAVLPLLLSDKTTKENLMWATESYANHEAKSQIQLDDVCLIQPRVQKASGEQADRTRAQGEVFTPSWICNKMNNFLDSEWFGRENVFNIEHDDEWDTIKAKIDFPEDKTWKDYILSRRIEITCGEAPFIVSRYDTATGDVIAIDDRIGQLDRKLRVVDENASNHEEWIEWTIKAFQSTYGYEFQGDNLFIARVNLLMTFLDHYNKLFNKKPQMDDVRKIANIIAWNFWQMDGLTGTIPFSGEESEQMELFSIGTEAEAIPCKTWDWRGGNAITYNSIRRNRV